ncbi:amidohydrolase family protein [Streptomyces sp. x-19]|uniref:amidohydrolase family protein n=1 Tax=Streptomyces sp. x-19 TaxID=2789280 RepID=UPI003980BEC2
MRTPAARSCGLAVRTGSITPGKDADVILLRTDDLAVFPVTDPAGSIVTAGHSGIVDTVLVAGRIVKQNGAPAKVALAPLEQRLLGSRDRIAVAAGIPLDGTWTRSRNRRRSSNPVQGRAWLASVGPTVPCTAHSARTAPTRRPA